MNTKSLVAWSLILLGSVSVSRGDEAIVDAGKFASLQAAADALPASGGVLRIPPGVYEIDAPVVIKTGDTTVIGCGAATHIRNNNTDGKPARCSWRMQLSRERRRRQRNGCGEFGSPTCASQGIPRAGRAFKRVTSRSS